MLDGSEHEQPPASGIDSSVFFSNQQADLSMKPAPEASKKRASRWNDVTVDADETNASVSVHSKPKWDDGEEEEEMYTLSNQLRQKQAPGHDEWHREQDLFQFPAPLKQHVTGIYRL